MGLCVFKYLVQSNIPEKSILFSFTFEGRRVAVNCEAADGAQALAYGTTDFAWIQFSDDPSPFSATLKLTFNDADKEEVSRRVRITPDASKVFGDILYDPQTFISVCFEANIDHYQNDFDSLTAISERILKRFLQKYSAVMNQGDIAISRQRRGQVVMCGYAETYTMGDGFLRADLANHKLTITQSAPLGRSKPKLTDADKGRIMSILAVDSDLTLNDRLLLDAREVGLIRNDYDLAIVTAGTAFEIGVQTLLKEYCLAHNIHRLPRNRRNAAYLTAIEEGNIKADLLRYVDHVLQVHPNTTNSVVKSQEYLDWNRNAYVRRNEIIHRGYIGSSEAEYIAAFIAITNLIALLKARLV